MTTSPVSFFDDDLYKFTMQQAVLKLYPDATAQYKFKNRGFHKFNDEIIDNIKNRIKSMPEIIANDYDLERFSKLSFIQPWYIEYLRQYRYNHKEVSIYLYEDKLLLEINGPWHSTILWEVKLMSIISECYFDFEKKMGLWSSLNQQNKAEEKERILSNNNCKFADFGTRRRRNFETQDLIVKTFSKNKNFVGTSNVHLALKHNVTPIGTMAHEWVQGISELESINHANRYMMQKWNSVYGPDLGIALTDTFGTDVFFKDFDGVLAKLYDGVRHDSGDPFEFADKVANHYKSLKVNPVHKSIIFSDGLNPRLAVDIKKHCDVLGINCAFGIGTNFTNDFETPPLNIVIKLWSINQNPVIKLSDNIEKANGAKETIKAVKWLLYRT